MLLHQCACTLADEFIYLNDTDITYKFAISSINNMIQIQVVLNLEVNHNFNNYYWMIIYTLIDVHIEHQF